MKTVHKITGTLLVSMLLTAGSMAQEVNVQSIDNTDPNRERIDTYSFIDDSKYINNWITVNPLETSMIKNSLVYELDTRDLKMNREDPDILLNFHIYDEKYSNEDYVGDAPYEYNYRKKQDIMSGIKDGTVVLSAIDPKSGESIWEGYANVDYDDSYSIRDKQIGIRKAADALIGRMVAETGDS